MYRDRDFGDGLTVNGTAGLHRNQAAGGRPPNGADSPPGSAKRRETASRPALRREERVRPAASDEASRHEAEAASS
jgi:hypothetical protein